MLAELAREVAESRSVTEGAIAFIAGLQGKLKEVEESGKTLEAMKADIATLAAELDAQQKNLAAALVTGTVADPVQPPPDNGVEAAPNVEEAPPPAEAVAAAAVETEKVVEDAAQPNP